MRLKFLLKKIRICNKIYKICNRKHVIKILKFKLQYTNKIVNCTLCSKGSDPNSSRNHLPKKNVLTRLRY